MICLDTTFLVDLWRNRSVPSHSTKEVMAQRRAEIFVVPIPAAGEFLEGAAFISQARFQEGLLFLRQFEWGDITIETAKHYAMIVADLRNQKLLSGISKFDLWIAAWTIEHSAELVTRNFRHFQNVQGLKWISYLMS